MRAPALDAPALDAALEGTPFHGGVEVHAELGSTIDRARELAEAGAPDGRVVLALAQRAGRGQRGNAWHSPAGTGLYLSALLRPVIPVASVPILAPLAGLAACDALRSLGVACRLKLPNDVVAVSRGAWRKVGGVLVDTSIQGDDLRHAIVSLGVNIACPDDGWPSGLDATAAACADLVPVAPTREGVAAAFLRALDGACREALGAGSPGGPHAVLARHAAHVRPVMPGEPAAGTEE